MVRMENIVQKGNIASCICIPENNSEQKFEVSFNLQTKENLFIDKDEYWYAGHAITALRKIWIESNCLPSELESQWY